jgi:hypothetical protein
MSFPVGVKYESGTGVLCSIFHKPCFMYFAVLLVFVTTQSTPA